LDSQSLRVSITYVLSKTLGLEHDHEPIVLDWLNQQLCTIYGDTRQLLYQWLRLCGADSCCPTVQQSAAAVYGAEVAPHRNVFGAQIYTDSECFEDPPSYCVLERIVAEESQMARATAWRDSRAYRNRQSTHAPTCQVVQVWSLSFL
jgi:hypothetical protein